MPESPSFRRLITELPQNSDGIYYRDNIGNISTSAVFQSSPESPKIVVLDTRYPLYGGWKISFYLGYNVPTEDLLNFNPVDNTYTLEVDFGIPIRDLWAQDMTIKIILPEGTTDISVDAPFNVQQSRTKRFTYLDSPILDGRNVIVLQKENIVDLHNKKFKVSFKFRKILMLHEPFLLIGAWFALFLSCIIFVRLYGAGTSKDMQERSLKKNE
mmetsp:Transcript_6195/g.9275  ORF Transcript_6195/g.9275 Transcript_6195/m.9275 type:complete len:213 (-) Transcript_6195:83-721(-)